MASGIICPTCGRAGTGKSNLISTLDKYTQSAYLEEEGFVFINPYWNLKMVPSFEYFDELIDELHLDVEADEKQLVKLPHFNLYRFDCLWVYSDSLICSLPFKGVEWFKQATFFLPPFNQELPDWSLLKRKLGILCRKAGFEFNHELQLWEDKSEKLKEYLTKIEGNTRKMDFPNDDEKKLLKRLESLVEGCVNELELTKKSQRRVYTQEYLDRVRPITNEFEKENDKIVIASYQELRRDFLWEWRRYFSHIERVVANTKGEKNDKGEWTSDSYQLFLPTDITKINEQALLISMERDFMAQWYPKLKSLYGNWKFQTRPLTKNMIENFTKIVEKNEKDEDFIRSRPLQSCVFCPSNENTSPTSGDDIFFDTADLVVNEPFDIAEYENKMDEWLRNIDEGKIRNNVENVIEGTYNELIDSEKVKKLEVWHLQRTIEILSSCMESVEIRDEKKNKCGISIVLCDQTIVARSPILDNELSSRKRLITEEISKLDQMLLSTEDEKEQEILKKRITVFKFRLDLIEEPSQRVLKFDYVALF